MMVINLAEQEERAGKIRRSKLSIFVDMLRLINRKGGMAKPTHILYGANLSHKRLTKYLEWMEVEGFVERLNSGGRTVYRITDKGQQFVVEFKKVEKFTEAFGINL